MYVNLVPNQNVRLRLIVQMVSAVTLVNVRIVVLNHQMWVVVVFLLDALAGVVVIVLLVEWLDVAQTD